VSVLSDETGAVLRRISYGVWGEVRTNQPEPGMASLDSAEKYTGQRYDAETSLYYYGARYYDPSLGRFMGADAVIASQYRTSALHPYTYVESNPLNYVDPSGNFAVGTLGAAGRFGGWHRPGQSTRNPVAELLGMLQEAIDRLRSTLGSPPRVESQGQPAQPEQSPEVVREAIAARAERAYANREPYGPNDKSGLFGPGTYKCNKFVTDVCNAVGAHLDLNVDEHGNAWPPLASTFGDPNVALPGWEIVQNPGPGDIVAQQRGYYNATGHVGIIVDKSLNVVSARDNGVSRDPLRTVFPENYRGDNFKKGPIVYRRYVGR
jgi:RHS repeat-associated protein